MKSNPNALISTMKDSIFTNVVHNLDDNNVVGRAGRQPAQKQRLTGRARNGITPTAQRALTPIRGLPPGKLPVYFPEFDSGKGVPIDAIVFGGRRAKTAPLVYQSLDWNHGVFVELDYGVRNHRRRDRRGRRCAATRWRCCRSAVTTWPITGHTGLRWAKSLGTRLQNL